MADVPAQLPTNATSPNYDDVVKILQVFFPQYFDEDSPDFVAPDTLIQLIYIAEEARPWCLSDDRQDFAQAMYTAYLVNVRNETSTGASTTPVSGPIIMEKEGDIQVQYAQSATGMSTSKRPASDPWDAWNRLWSRCARGAIMTRYGDPVKSAGNVSLILWQRAFDVWYPIY